MTTTCARTGCTCMVHVWSRSLPATRSRQGQLRASSEAGRGALLLKSTWSQRWRVGEWVASWGGHKWMRVCLCHGRRRPKRGAV